MAGACGDCSLCCEVMRVSAPGWDKPPRQRCPHQCKRGCGIYEQRPENCEGFECLWLVSQHHPDGPDFALPRDLRPDRCGVVIEPNEHGNIVAHCKFPAAWKKPAVLDHLLGFAGRTTVLIETSNDATPFRLLPDGSTRLLRYIGSDPVTNCRKYVDLGEDA